MATSELSEAEKKKTVGNLRRIFRQLRLVRKKFNDIKKFQIISGKKKKS